uniref:Thioredoxin n=1 Tax=Caligus rogercresseyi TaxID=217165 RepID=C1BPF8_CALRO|nr:Thioredoxin-2 [Caligus rogercresseyi]ACO11052.1 Thioredoxin-2 [Caligus rogercresseyi]ACO11228.1 Thioredoxin-2 [Caligus rogercresseyi]|eukprot:TRINITY_DN116_c0_g1_i1.p1 TRINITY_DN116_c0_g1~~TRINITY_DN116_c0_g1_i1.p1  ORF type:complete len:106 (+),score=42.80 TRINITY_DN116_c0_g1_i1:211-528(+)
MVKEIKDMSEFNAQLSEAGAKLVVVDFFAPWCGPCKVIAPQIEEWSKNMEDVVFIKVDVDEAEDIAQHYNITAMPSFFLFKETKKVADLVGANTAKLEELIKSHK